MIDASTINKALGKASKHFCNQMVANGNRQMYQNVRETKKKETVEITMKEQLFKGQDIDVFFEGKEDDLSDLRLKVYVNQDMKFVSQAGAFIVKTIQIPRIVRKGWFFTTVFTERRRLIFKQQEEFERFQRFTTMLRDCEKVNNLYKNCCYNYVEEKNI